MQVNIWLKMLTIITTALTFHIFETVVGPIESMELTTKVVRLSRYSK